jgi:hypothetical protein
MIRYNFEKGNKNQHIKKNNKKNNYTDKNNDLLNGNKNKNNSHI